jgi:hypothetical protein
VHPTSNRVLSGAVLAARNSWYAHSAAGIAGLAAARQQHGDRFGLAGENA